MDEEKNINLWLDYIGASKNTRRSYNFVIFKFKKFINKNILDANPIDISNFISRLSDSRGTKKHHLGVLKSYFRFNHEMGFIEKNILTSYKMPKIKNNLSNKIVSESDIILMIHSEPCERNRLILKLLYNTGMRASEICEIRISDITQDGEDAAVLTVNGKGDKIRHNRVSGQLWHEIRLFIEKNKKIDEDWLFTRLIGRKKYKISYNLLYLVVKNAAKRINKDKKISVHTFRHCHITHSLNRGCPVHIVKEQVGHSSLATTGQYTHLLPKQSSGAFLLNI